MSNRGTDWARTRRFGSSAKKAIAYVLGDHHNGETGRLDPSVETIANEADLSPRAVQINLREMERAGALMVLRTPGRRSCSYVLNWDWRGIDGNASPIQRRPKRTRPNPAYDCTNPSPNPAPDSPKPEREDSTGKKEERVPPQAAAPSPPPSQDRNLLATKEGSPTPRPKPPRQDTRRIPLPDDWVPSAEERQLALDGGFDPSELVQEMEDWALSTGARSADWDATYRRWVRREQKFARPQRKQSSPRQSRPAAAMQAMMAVIAANRAARGEAMA